MPKPITPVSKATRAPQVFNQTADRTMTYYSVADIELKTLNRSGTLETVGFTVATTAVAIGVDAFRTYQAGDKGALGWILGSAFVAVCFFILAGIGVKHQRGIIKDIKQGSPNAS